MQRLFMNNNHISYIPDNMTQWESYNVRRKYELPASMYLNQSIFIRKITGYE